MRRWTDRQDVFRDVDVLVAGGGPAGVAAAVNAARAGARTLIVERYGRLGGAATTGLVGPLMGGACSDFVDEVQRRFDATGQDWERLDLLYADMLLEAGAEILLHTWAFEALIDGGRVCGVRAVTKQGLLAMGAKVVIDATADADIAHSAGAACEMGRDDDGLLQPMSIQYRIGGVDKGRGLLCGGEHQALKVTVPEGVWRDVVLRARDAGELPQTVGVVRLYEAPNPGERIVNATQVNHVDGTRVEDLTRAELEGRRQAFAVTEFLRRHAPGYEGCYIVQMPTAVGVRETRRLVGVERLGREDLVSGRKRRSAVVRDASFVIDIHNPNGVGQAHGFAETVKPYDIPYGCLVPREVDGLVVAGRCISGSHEAHASYRVQRIVMAIGAAAGVAAALAATEAVLPREVAVDKIQRGLNLEVAPAATD